jgi:predicted transcriptional regulator
MDSYKEMKEDMETLRCCQLIVAVSEQQRAGKALLSIEDIRKLSEGIYDLSASHSEVAQIITDLIQELCYNILNKEEPC